MDDVAADIVDKLVRRHPHVFGDVTVADADEVNANWDKTTAPTVNHRRRPALGNLVEDMGVNLPGFVRR